MKIDVTQLILGLDGEPIGDAKLCDACLREGRQTIIEQKPLTLRAVLTSSLVNPHKSDEPDIEKKLARFNLAMEIQRGGIFECDKARLDELRQRVNLLNDSALVVGRVCELLDKAAEEDNG